MTRPALRQFRKRTDLTIADLADAARSLLAGVRQTRYKVTAAPDIRTLRYYLREGLLDRPLSYDGGRARFGYRHLLQVLVTKRLQADYLPLRRIKPLVSGIDVPQLEALATGRRPAPGRNPAGEPRTEGLAMEEAGPYDAGESPAGGGLRAAPEVWQRHQLAPGIEVHVRDGVTLSTPELRQRIRERFVALLRAKELGSRGG